MQERYAIETRAQVLRLVSAHAAVRRGESDRVEIGRTASSDAVTGAESLGVGGDLVEHLHSRSVDALRLETCVDGGLALHSHSDLTLLGGAMAEAHAGPVLVAAGMSDDLVAGGGIRLAAAELRLAGLLGGEERVGTVHADGAVVEAYGTHFEREYGCGSHNAGFAHFSGAVFATAASGFRPLFKVMNGVRNLSAGGGGAAVADVPETAGARAAPPVPPPLPTAAAGIGMLRARQAIALQADAMADLDAAFDAQRFGDVSRYLQQSQDAGVAARSPDTADTLAELRRLTQADVDQSLLQVRTRAGLPDDAGMGEAIDFLRRAGRGEAGDLELQRAALALREDLAAATQPFLQPLVARGLAQEDLQALTLDEVRRAFAHELQRTRNGGDVDAVADLQAAYIGFDTVVFRSASTLVERFGDGASASLAPEVATPLLSRLLELRLEWADEPGKMGILDLAIDEARHGDDPMPVIDDHLRQVIWACSEVLSREQLDALQEAVATIRLTVDDAAGGGAAAEDVVDVVRLNEFGDVDQAGAQGWRSFAGGGLVDASAGESLFDRVADANMRALDDLTLDDGAAAGADAHVYETIRPLPDACPPPLLHDGSYPFVPPPLPTDADGRELSRSLRGYRATLIDPTTGLPPAGAAANDVLMRAKRRAVTDALDAVRRGQDPAAVLDEQIRAAKRRAHPPAWVIAPVGLPLIDGELDVLEEVRYVVDGLLEQHRSTTPLTQVASVDDTARIDALRRYSATSGPLPTLPPERLDFVTTPAMQPLGRRADAYADAHDYEEIASLATANVRYRGVAGELPPGLRSRRTGAASARPHNRQLGPLALRGIGGGLIGDLVGGSPLSRLRPWN